MGVSSTKARTSTRRRWKEHGLSCFCGRLHGEDAVKIISKVNWFTRKEKPFHSASPQNSNATPKPKPKPKSKGKAQAKGKAKGQKRKAAEMDQEDAGGCEDKDADEDQEEQEQEEEDIWDPLNDGEENIG